MAFATFVIAPSNDDIQDVKEELAGLLEKRIEYNPETGSNDTLPGFRATTNDSSFVMQNSDIPYVGEWYRKGDLPAEADSTLFAMGVGGVFGPYVSDNQAEIAKVLDKRSLPDSARASHILISFSGSQAQPKIPRNMERAKFLADSLEGVLKANPGAFNELVATYSDDIGSAAKDGDLDWFGPTQMVKPFADFCFESKDGAMGVVLSQFGYHIIKVTGQKGSGTSVKVARVVRAISPSEATLDNIYNRASSLASQATDAESFANLAVEMGVVARPAANVGSFDENIPGLGNEREVVRWAFEDKRSIGDKHVFSLRGQYAVVLLTDLVDDGYQSLEQVEDVVREKVLNAKKAERYLKQIKESAAGKTNLDEVAAALGRQSQSVAVTMTQSAIVGVGNEPKVIGAMNGVAVGGLYGPIEGNRGVFMVSAESRQPAGDPGDYAQYKNKLEQAVIPNVSNLSFESLKESAKIKDNRARFF